MSMAAVVRCLDAECRRTLAHSIQSIVTVTDTPPSAAPWLLITDDASWQQEAYSIPPHAILCLGDAPPATPCDVLPAPFRLQDFVFRVQVLAKHTVQPVLRDSRVMLDAVKRQLSDLATGQSVELTEKETQMLSVLMRGEGKALEKEALLRDVWAYAPEVNTHTLETHISRLRAKLQHFPAPPQIVAEAGGYRLQNMV